MEKGSEGTMKAVEKGSGMPRLCKRRKAVGCQGNAVKKAAGCQGKVAKKGSGMPRKGCEERQWGAKERQWATKGEAVKKAAGCRGKVAKKGSGVPRKGSGLPRERQWRKAAGCQGKGSVAPPRRGRPLPRSGRPGRKGLSPSGHRIREAQSSSQVAEAIYQKLTVAACDAV